MTDEVVLAVDVGGTSLKGALIDRAGQAVAARTVPLDGRRGDAAFAQLASLCLDLQAVARARGLTMLGAGVISPGMDDVAGRVIYASNLGWRDLPVQATLEGQLGVPVSTGHDVRSAGLAEGLLGAARGARDFVFVMIGTGIAAALVANGLAVRGARNIGGEVGHAPVIPGGELCPCGQRGCLEAYASAAAIARRYRALGGLSPLTAAEIGMAQAHDPLARQVWIEAVEALATSLITLTMLFDPGLVVLGGGLVEAGATLLDPLAAAVSGRLAWREAPPIHRSTLGLEAGRLGAAILAFRGAGLGDVVAGWRV